MSTLSFDMPKKALFRALLPNGALDHYIENFDGVNMSYLKFQQRPGAPALSPTLLALSLLPENAPPAIPQMLPIVPYADPLAPTVFEIQTQATAASMNEKYRVSIETTRRREQQVTRTVRDAMTTVPAIKLHSSTALDTATLYELRYIHLANYLQLEENEKSQLSEDAKTKFNPFKSEEKELSLLQIVNKNLQEDNDIKLYAAANGITFYAHQQVENVTLKYNTFFKDAINNLYLTTANPTEAAVIVAITNAAKIMDRDANWRNIKDVTTTKQKVLLKADFKEYCWAHGPNTTHSPYKFANDPILNSRHECKASSKVPGFQIDATFANKKGGKTKRWATGDKLGP